MKLKQIQGDRIHIVSVEGDNLGTLQSIDQGGVAQPTNAYEGPYTVTPGLSRQTLDTTGKVMTEDVTIEKIPSNYGRIDWNGSRLLVY